MNEGTEKDDLHGFSDIDGDDIPQNNISETQEHVNLNADTHPSDEYTQDSTQFPSQRGEERTSRSSRSHEKLKK